MSKKRKITSSFVYALEGIQEAFKSEPNFRLHILAATIVTIAGFYFKIQKSDWLVLVLAITIVVVLELVNTAIEAIVDIASPKISKLAKIAKDVSAAAVLISSIGATIIGFIVFLPKIVN